jgi:hypothetical protein
MRPTGCAEILFAYQGLDFEVHRLLYVVRHSHTINYKLYASTVMNREFHSIVRVDEVLIFMYETTLGPSILLRMKTCSWS